MKVLMMLLTVSILCVSGCATDRYQIPLTNWDKAAPKAGEIRGAEPLPLLCKIADNGQWTARCWGIFERYEIIAERNTLVAQANADALGHSEAATRQLIEAAKVQQEVSQIRQRMLEDEQRGRTYDKWYYRILIGAIAVGAML